MQRAGLDNANPTILSLSQLPSRSGHEKRGPRARSDGIENKYDHIIYPPGTILALDANDDGDDDQGLDYEPIDEQEIYDLISTISDPEHPHTLGQLSVVNLRDIHIRPSPAAAANPLDPAALTTVLVEITPTINHCSLATVIGLAVRVRLERSLPPNWRVDVCMKQGTHAQDDQVTKQLADKERVAAALENKSLKATLDQMFQTCV